MDNVTNDPQLEIVQQRWAPIEFQEAQLVCAKLREPLSVTSVISHSARPMAAGCLVQTDRQAVYIKRYPISLRQADSILPYHRFAEHVRDAGISTPKFLDFMSDKTTILQSEGMIYEVCTLADGEDRYRHAYTWDPPRTAQEAYSLGAFVARLALAAETFDEPAMPWNVFSSRFTICAHDDVLAAGRCWLDCHQLIAKTLARYGRDFVRDLEGFVQTCQKIHQIGYSDLPTQWTHSDPHISNFMWDVDAPCAVFDFGLADRNTALYDLVMLLERHSIQWLDIMNGHAESVRIDIAQALIDGYTSIRSLSIEERELIPYVLSVSQIEAACTYIAYYVLSGGSAQDILWCYDVGFRGHAQWFMSNSGLAYLNYLRSLLRVRV